MPIERVWEAAEVPRGQLKASHSLVCVRSSTQLVALDATTGQERWSRDSEYCDHVEDHLVVGEMVVLVIEGERILRGCDPSSGESLWTTKEFVGHPPCPWGDEVVMVSGQPGGTTCVVTGLDNANGGPRWATPEMPALVTQPRAAGERLFTFPHNEGRHTGNVVCWQRH